MNRDISVFTLWLLALAACGVEKQLEPTRPNFVFFLIDDLGWVDTGVYGSSFYETPNIDRLAAEGVRFTQFYTGSPVCSPTRASIMTGKNPARVHITNWIGGEAKGKLLQAEYLRQLPLEEITLGEAFKEAGYATGYIGKWHLGQERYLPEAQGFDFIKAVNNAGQPGSYFHPYVNDKSPITSVPDLEDGNEGDYLTDVLTDEALRFIENERDGSFFLVLSHYAVHTPLESKENLTEKYRAKANALQETQQPTRPEGKGAVTKLRQDHPVYGGMIQSTDESVGRVLAKLEELQLTENTIVFFVSDNGGLTTLENRPSRIPTAVLPLRAGKGWLYEGGIRVPLIVKWPGVIEAGRVIDEPAVTMDLYPTMLTMAGLPLRPEQHQDGISLERLLLGTGRPNHPSLYWHFPHYHGSGNIPSSAIRTDNFKLIEWLEDGTIELYDLENDIGEIHNLAATMPQKAEELRKLLDNWRRHVDAKMPIPNPDWSPENP